jgi:hypothetical protein
MNAIDRGMQITKYMRFDRQDWVESVKKERKNKKQLTRD